MNDMDEAAVREVIRSVLSDVVPSLRTAGAMSSAPLTPKPGAGVASSRSGQGNFGAFSAGESSNAERPVPGVREQSQPSGAGAEVIGVAIENDHDLRALVFEVLRHADNPRRRDDIRAGRLTFRLTTTQRRPAATTRSEPTPVRVDRGALTERMVQAAAGTQTAFILGRGVSVTPLAAESARSLGIAIEKEK